MSVCTLTTASPESYIHHLGRDITFSHNCCTPGPCKYSCPARHSNVFDAQPVQPALQTDSSVHNLETLAIPSKSFVSAPDGPLSSTSTLQDKPIAALDQTMPFIFRAKADGPRRCEWECGGPIHGGARMFRARRTSERALEAALSPVPPLWAAGELHVSVVEMHLLDDVPLKQLWAWNRLGTIHGPTFDAQVADTDFAQPRAASWPPAASAARLPPPKAPPSRAPRASPSSGPLSGCRCGWGSGRS